LSQKNEENLRQEMKDDDSSKGKNTVNRDLDKKEKEGEEKDKDKDKQVDSDKEKNKKRQKKHSLIHKNKFSNTSFYVKLMISILIAIVAFNIIPIIELVVVKDLFTTYTNFLKIKTVVDNTSQSLIQYYEFSQEIYSKLAFNLPLTPDSLQKLQNLNQNFKTNFNEFSYTYSQALKDNMQNLDDLKSLLDIKVCDNFKKYNTTSDNCDYYEGILNQKGLNSVINLMVNHLNEMYSLLITQKKYISHDQAIQLYNSDGNVTPDILYIHFINNGFDCIIKILMKSVDIAIQTTQTELLALFILFIISMLFNLIYVWKFINKTYTDLELDTFRVFSILPNTFIKKEYGGIIEFIKMINDE